MARKRKSREDKFVSSAQPCVYELRPCVIQSTDKATARHGHRRQETRSDPQKNVHYVDDWRESLARKNIDTTEDDVLPSTKTEKSLSEQRKLSRKLRKKERRRLRISAIASTSDNLSADSPKNGTATTCATTKGSALGSTDAPHSIPPKTSPPLPAAHPPPALPAHAVQPHQDFSDRYGLQQAKQLARAAARRAQSGSSSPKSRRELEQTTSVGASTMCGSSIPVMTLNPDLVVSNAIPEVVYTRYVRLGEGYVLGHEARILGVGPVDDSSASHEVCVGMETEPTHYSRVKQITSEALVSSQQPHEASPDTALNFALSHEQQQLVDLIGKGNNVFYTGSAGTGKSTVLRAFVADFERQGKVVVKVAPTGVAALNIGGQTYFKFAGWAKGSQKRSLQMLENGARTQHKRWKRLNEADVLVIDEVSMMDAHQLDRLDRVCRAARQPSEELQGWEEYHGGQARSPHDPSMPFGGMQIIVTGDFCQLPPVLPFTTCFPCGKTTDDLGHGTRRCEPCDKIFRDGDEWAFKSSAWKACNFTNVQLMSVHRQVDADFVAILQSLRAGQCPSPSQLRLLLDHPCQTEGAIKLFPRKQEAQAENYKRLQEIPLQAIVYNCIDHTTSQVALPHPDSLYEQLALKKGMLVMNIINGPDGSGIVNGSQGQLLDFLPFEHARLDADAADEADRLPLARGDHARYRDGMIRKWMRLAPGALLPYVQFFTGQRAVIFPVCDVEEIGDEEPYILSSRTQLPLLPAWAISVHKSQGMTLDRVFIDIDRSFKDEMAYVALSRARSLYGLEVRSANGLAKLRTARRNPVVHKFLEDCFGEQRNGLANHTQ